MKALVIDDPSVSGHCGLVCHAVLEATGHAARFVKAPLVFEAKSRSGYTSELFNLILSEAQEFSPDWVIMVLQGLDTTGQIALATAIHEKTPAARFYFISGSPHEEELDYARSKGLTFHFEAMPVNPEKFSTDIEQFSANPDLL